MIMLLQDLTKEKNVFVSFMVNMSLSVCLPFLVDHWPISSSKGVGETLNRGFESPVSMHGEWWHQDHVSVVGSTYLGGLKVYKVSRYQV